MRGHDGLPERLCFGLEEGLGECGAKPIRLDVGDGPGEALAWGCDLSAEYVRINADYTT